MLQQFGAVETHFRGHLHGCQVEHRVESARRHLWCDPSRHEDQLISRHRPIVLLVPPVHVLAAQIRDSVCPTVREREPCLLSKLSKRCGTVIVVLPGAHDDPSSQLRSIGVVHATPGKHNETSKEPAGVTTHHQDLERVSSRPQQDDRRCRIGNDCGVHDRILRTEGSEPGTLLFVTTANPYRDLPSVDALVSSLKSPLPHQLLVEVVRAAVDEARSAIESGEQSSAESIAREALAALEKVSGVRVINATGVLLHTNLGRARWSEEAVRRAADAARDATNLEMDIETGERSRRGTYVTRLLTALTGAEDALVVNNNASALMLALASTSSGRAVPVSRGELIEIGGSYRLPDVITASGARLIEVGTTNRTRLGDYETALQTDRCGSIVKIHPSNYRIDGFTSEATVQELAALAHEHDLPLVHDIGSGLLDEDVPWLDGPAPDWLSGEPAARQSLEAGADLVTFSGDKLLGGPQAGLIVGTAEAVGGLRSHPMARALRVDGVTIAGVGATLEAFLAGDVTKIPFWRQALIPYDTMEKRAAAAAEHLGGKIVPGGSAVGAGSVPGMTIPTPLLVLEGQDHLFRALLAADTPVLARREAGSLVIDLRTVDDDQELIDAVESCR